MTPPWSISELKFLIIYEALIYCPLQVQEKAKLKLKGRGPDSVTWLSERVIGGELREDEMDLSLVPYVSSPAPEKGDGGTYRECLKNHAAAMGGQAFDGCGEFMAGDGDPLKCAACGCHRNFHRRDGSPDLRPLAVYDRKHAVVPSPTPVAFFPPPPQPFHPIPAPEMLAAGRGGSETPPRRQEGLMRKRYRTKFTTEQKEKMRIFAEKLGWRIQKHDCEALEKFCVQIGVKRHVLKIWMHNHKNNHSSGVGINGGERDAAAAPPPIRV